MIGATLGFIILATIIGLTIDALDLFILHANHAVTNGRVVRVIPNSRGLTEIAYSVGGKAYQRTMPVRGVAGDRLEPFQVYDHPRDPSIASAIPAGERLLTEIPAWMAGSVFGAFIGATIARQIDRALAAKRDA